MPEKTFSQRPVEALHDTLVPVDVNPTAPNLDRVLRQQLTDGAHELAPRVNLKELRPPQGAPLVNPSKAIGDLYRSLASYGVYIRHPMVFIFLNVFDLLEFLAMLMTLILVIRF